MRNRSLLLVVVLIIAVVLTACLQPPTTSPETTAATTATPMSNMNHATMVDASQPFDTQFIDSMIEHHQGAIGMAEVALEQAEHKEIRTLAEDIIAAQSAEIEQLQSWRSEWYPDLAPTGGMEMAMGTMGINEDASVPFDQRFIGAMISHHQGAIDMAQMALEQAEHEEVRTLAEAIIAAQTAEIEQMLGWLADWYGEQTQATTSASPLSGTRSCRAVALLPSAIHSAHQANHHSAAD
jgi:uncharacterized protein (DUF305 family)